MKFLNYLDFPVQFVVTTNSLNINSYLESLKKIVTDEALFNDFSEFMKSTIQKNEMRNRSFFFH
jgi:hypothetical protein